MFKCIALLKKKPGLSRAEFIEYYENRHSVLARKLLPGIRDYRRNFLDPDGAVLSPGAPAIDFDVVTEMWFADRGVRASDPPTLGVQVGMREKPAAALEVAAVETPRITEHEVLDRKVVNCLHDRSPSIPRVCRGHRRRRMTGCPNVREVRDAGPRPYE